MSERTGKIRIDSGRTGYQSRVYLDGVDISHIIVALDFQCSVDSVNTLNLRLIPTEIEIEGDAAVVLERFAAQPNADGFVETTAMGDEYVTYAKVVD